MNLMNMEVLSNNELLQKLELLVNKKTDELKNLLKSVDIKLTEKLEQAEKRC